MFGVDVSDIFVLNSCYLCLQGYMFKLKEVIFNFFKVFTILNNLQNSFVRALSINSLKTNLIL